MEQQIRYCTTSDGVRIAYATAGEGPPLVLVSGWISHLQFEWEHPDSRAVWQELARGRTLIRFDRRGTGLSDWKSADSSLKARLLDLEAVVDKLGLERFALMGWSEGGWTAAAYAAQHPEKVSQLIIYGSWYKCPWTPEMLEPIVSLIRSHWGMGSAALASIFVPSGDPSWLKFFTELQRIGSSAEAAARTQEVNQTIDITQLLGRIRAPTLVLHRRDEMIPFRQAQEMAALIPDARLEPLEGDIHPIWWGDRKAIIDAVRSFLGTEREGPAELTAIGFQTILFTDVVGHTEMMARLGDDRGREVLREHERITREVLKAHGGTEVKTMGDGFMASFGSITKALECAVALQRGIAERNGSASEPLQVRVGLNAGEPIAEEGDLFGSAVILAARIAAQAGAGEILIPEPVRHLLAGKGFLFSDRGEVVLKGFEDPIRLYEVQWRN